MSLVYWLWVTPHVPEVVGLNPSAIYWMDIFSLMCYKNCIVCLKRPKIKKEAGVGPFKKPRECFKHLSDFDQKDENFLFEFPNFPTLIVSILRRLKTYFRHFSNVAKANIWMKLFLARQLRNTKNIDNLKSKKWLRQNGRR